MLRFFRALPLQKATFETFLYALGPVASAVYRIDGVLAIIFPVTDIFNEPSTGSLRYFSNE